MDNEKSATPNSQLLRHATYASVAVACFLILIKLTAFLLTNSISLLATLVDSFLDAGASLLNLFAIRQALTPADKEHRFGHGKAEALAGLGQAAFIGGSALFLLFEATGRLMTPHTVNYSWIGITVMLISIVTTLCLVAFQKRVIQQTNSVAISADALHYKGDLMVNASVILALLLTSQFGWVMADPILCLGIAGYILLSAWWIIRQSIDHLMDHEISDEIRAQIKEIALRHPQVVDLHDLRTRQSGPDIFVQLHLEMDAGLTLYAAHNVSSEVQESILELLPNAEIIIHEDAVGVPKIS